MSQEIYRPALWVEVERVSALWTESLGAPYPVIPLDQLRPLWNSVAAFGMSQRDRLRHDAALAESLYLKQQNVQLRNEVQSLRQQLAQVTDLGVAMPVSDSRIKQSA